MADEKRSGSGGSLEGFVLLAKGVRGGGTVQIIKEVLKNPNIFVFGELLALQSVQELEKTEQRQWLDLLRLFAYGTYSDYKRESKKLPELGVAELQKLKLLSIVSLACHSKSLSYSALMSELDVSSVRDVEDLVIDAINAGLIDGALDQKGQAFHVTFASGRDLGPNDVSSMISSLDSWLGASNEIVKTLQTAMDSAFAGEEQKKIDESKLEEERKNKIENLKNQKENERERRSGDREEDEGKRRGKPLRVAGPMGLFSGRR